MNEARGNKAIGLMGLARRAGMLVVGEENCGVATRSGRVRVLLLAQDASDNAVRRAEGFAADRIPIVRLPYSKDELAMALGKASCSMAAATDIGFAFEIVSALGNEEELGEIAAELLQRRDRAIRRKSAKTSGTTRKTGIKGRKKQ